MRQPVVLAALVSLMMLALSCSSKASEPDGSDPHGALISAGGGHSCELLAGQVNCWGNNYSGEVGTNDLTDFISTKTEPVDLGEPAVDLAIGDAFSCAVVESGSVWCWGENRFGHLGADTHVKSSRVPLQVAGLEGAVSVGAGDHHACAVIDTGAVRCWGFNEYGQLGNGLVGTDENAFAPVKVAGLQGIVQVDGGSDHTCAVSDAGDIYCWGWNANGRLGDGSETDRLRPTRVRGLPGPATSVTLGSGHTCALLKDGRVFCWGINTNGQLANGIFSQDAEINATPQEIEGIDGRVMLLSAGADHTCAATSTEVYCWGSNELGQLGAIEESYCMLTATPCQLRPIQVEHLRDGAGPISIGAGFRHTCVLYGDGGAMCWGGNGVGQLGDGTMTDSLEPVTVTSDTPGSP